MMGFCEKCHDIVEYTIRGEKKEKMIKGKNIEYMGKEAYCNECGSEIFVAELRDANLVALDKAYREKEDLIFQSEVEEILRKYDIGKRPLSLLLGWGEGTITRYLNGGIPTKLYSDILRKVLHDPNSMEEILERNKENITRIAYEKCKSALLNIKTEAVTVEAEDKIDHVVKYLLSNSMDITPLALQKLLYFSQGFYKAFTGEYLFYNDCEAWVHGPVYKNIYFKYKSYGYNPIDEGTNQYDDIILSDIEKEVLDSVISNFGCYSGKILEKMTHTEKPWRETRNGLNENEGTDRIIDKTLIAQYFTDIKQKYNMLNLTDIRDYSNDLFSKVIR